MKKSNTNEQQEQNTKYRVFEMKPSKVKYMKRLCKKCGVVSNMLRFDHRLCLFHCVQSP